MTGRASLSKTAWAKQVKFLAVAALSALVPFTTALAQPVLSWSDESDQAGALFGEYLSGAGDVNGDGFADIVVSAHEYSNGQENEGRVQAYYGSVTGLATTPSWTAESNLPFAGFGEFVASAGDVNGDSFSDILIGAEDFTNGQNNEGRVFLYLGSASGLDATPLWVVESNQALSYFGIGVAGAGDVNGDGYADILVGASHFDNGQTDEGKAFLYLGSPTGPSTVAAWTGEGNQVSARYGRSVASAGDVDNDGFADVIVGASTFSNGESGEGKAFLYLGSSTGLSTTASWTGEGQQVASGYGRKVASAGDTNGDGFADVLVGASDSSDAQSGSGRAYLYLGSASGLSTLPFVVWQGTQAGERLGSAVAGAGDVDRDGYADVLIGAPEHSNGQSKEGRISLFRGSAAGPSTVPAWTVDGERASAFLGSGAGLASAGDTNGDGYADILAGASNFSNGQDYEGTASVYLGYGTAGDATGDQVPDAAQIGFGKVSEVVALLPSTPTVLRFGGAALATDIAKLPKSGVASLISVVKSGNTFQWMSTYPITQKSRVFQTVPSAGSPVVGCHRAGSYTPAAFLPNSKNPRLKLYSGGAGTLISLPKGALSVRCGAPVGGSSGIFSLVRNAKSKAVSVVAKAGAKKLFTSKPLDKKLATNGMQLAIVPRGAGKQPTVMVLAKRGSSTELHVRDKSNRWRKLPISGVPVGSKPTGAYGVRIGNKTYAVVQLTNQATVTSYKAVLVPATFL